MTIFLPFTFHFFLHQTLDFAFYFTKFSFCSSAIREMKALFGE